MRCAAEIEGLRAELTSSHSNTQLDSKQIALLTDKLNVLRDELTASIARAQVRRLPWNGQRAPSALTLLRSPAGSGARCIPTWARCIPT